MRKVVTLYKRRKVDSFLNLSDGARGERARVACRLPEPRLKIGTWGIRFWAMGRDLGHARYGLRPHEAMKLVALVQKSGSEYRFSNSDIDISLIYPDPTS